MLHLNLTTFTTDELLQTAMDGLEAQRVKLLRRIGEVRGMMFGTTIGEPDAPDADDSDSDKVADTALSFIGRGSRFAALAAPASFTKRELAGKPKLKRKVMSAAGRAAIVAAQKKRWAKVRGEAKTKAAGKGAGKGTAKVTKPTVKRAAKHAGTGAGAGAGRKAKAPVAVLPAVQVANI